MKFDRVMCVNLDRRPDRWQLFLAGCPAVVRDRVERFSATDGQQEAAPGWWQHRGCKGCWGCRRSQERLLAKCVADGAESVLVFEDDATPVAEFAARWKLLEETLPADWQMCWLGGNLLEQPRKISDAIYAPLGIYTCHALAIRQPAMGKLLAMLRDESRWNDEINPDVAYSNYAGSEPGGVYCPARWLFNQRGGQSDIRGIDAEPGVFVDACDYGRGKITIDRALVINLDRRADRLASFQANYPAELPRAERFAATDGRTVKAPEWFTEKKKPSVWGIYDSHCRLLTENLDVETLLFFEDDAVPSPQFSKLWHEFIDALPADWQMVWLGGNQMDNTKRRINRHVWYPGKLHACHAILMRQPLIREMAAFLAKPQREAHVDHVYAWYCANRTDRVYAPGHWLFHQAAGFSDHTGRPTRLFTGRDLDQKTSGKVRQIVREQPCDAGPDGVCRRDHCGERGRKICRVGNGIMVVPA